MTSAIVRALHLFSLLHPAPASASKERCSLQAFAAARVDRCVGGKLVPCHDLYDVLRMSTENVLQRTGLLLPPRHSAEIDAMEFRALEVAVHVRQHEEDVSKRFLL